MAAEIALLGHFLFTADDVEIDMSQNAACMIAALGVFGPNPVPRSELGSLLWPTKPASRVVANLRGVLWRLPEEVRAALLVTDELVGFKHSTVVDVWSLFGDDPAGLELSRLRSTLLPGWYSDWVLAERDRLRGIQLAALEQRAERLIAFGRASEAIELGLASIRIEPLREEPHHLVLAAHMAEGNVAEAFGHLTFMRRLFRRELGVELGQKTLDLVLDREAVTDVRRATI